MPRKKHNIHYIYKTTCLITKKYYIGIHSTTNINDGYLGSGLRLRRSIRKYGIENHVREILEFFPNRNLLMEKEKEIVTSEFIKDELCMNLKEGGNGGWTHEQHVMGAYKSHEVVRYKLKTDPEYSERLRLCGSIHNKRKIEMGIPNVFPPSASWKGRTHTEESKRKIGHSNSKNHIGKLNPQYGKCWIYNEHLKLAKSIKKSELEYYILNGWKKGRT
jgi:hypothetical protein